VLEAGTSIGGYVLVKTIGSGATAVVYEAKRDGHVLALKVLRPRRFSGRAGGPQASVTLTPSR
jgi:hypothetical protein